MTDKELIEMAAKAAGCKIYQWPDKCVRTDDKDKPWNPLTDDGDALRLAVKLQLEIYIDHRGVAVRTHCGLKVLERDFNAKATRRAITIAAAQIGKEME